LVVHAKEKREKDYVRPGKNPKKEPSYLTSATLRQKTKKGQMENECAGDFVTTTA